MSETDTESPVPFTPSHLIGDTPVMMVRRPKGPPFYQDAEGKGRRATPQSPLVPLIPGIPLRDPDIAPDEDGEAEDAALAQTRAIEVPLELSIEELSVCTMAVSTQYRAELGSTIAVWKGGRKVCLSRRVAGADTRWLIDLPATYRVTAEPAP